MFREFLRSEYSEDNLLFYMACENLKKEEDPGVLKEKVQKIFEDYISTQSSREVFD